MKEELIFKYFDGKANKEEQEIIFKWLDEDKNNKKIFARLKQIYIEIISSLGENNNTENAYSKLLLRIKYFEEQKEVERKARIIKLRDEVLRWVAILLLIFFVGTLSYYYGRKGYFLLDNKYCEIKVPFGSRTMVTLPDGTKVWLNAGSKLKYRQNFLQEKRIVNLEGEAYFEVVKYHNIPFYVNTSDINIVVLGTKFNVRSYPEDKIIEATLIEGKIKVVGKNSNYSLYLKPKQKLIVDKENLRLISKIIDNTNVNNETKEDNIQEEKNLQVRVKNFAEIKENINVYEDTGWKDGVLVFNQEPLENLAKKLERKYDIKFVFEDEDLKKLTYTGTLKDYPLEQVLKAIKLTSPVDYNINEKIVKLYRK